MKLDSYDLNVLDKAEKTTLVDYEIKKYSMTNGGYIASDKLIALIEDLLTEIDVRDEKIAELQNYENDYPDEERDREREVLGI